MSTQRQNQAKPSSPSSALPVQTSLFQPQTFNDPTQEADESLHSSHQSPDLQTQLERASRFGHNFSRVQVTNTPAVIQPQLDVGKSQEQEDDQKTESVAEPIKQMAPPGGDLSEHPDQEEETIQMMPLLGLLTPTIQRQDQEEELVQTMPLLGFLAPTIQRQDQQDEELVQTMPQWGRRQRLPQEEDNAPIQMMPQWGVIQRQEPETTQEAIQTKWLQAKLVVGTPGDKYEQEADSMAAQVMSMSAPPTISEPIQRQGEEEEQEPLLQKSPLAESITPLVQRQTEEQQEQIQAKPLLKRAGAKDNDDEGSDLENKLTSSKGGGSPLPDEVRSFMEPRFGNDFSAVRVHTDSTAVEMNKELGAQAFTHGSDIYYGTGKSPGKNALTAHELTHTVQQGAVGKTKPKQNSTGKDEGNKDEKPNENVADENAARKDKGSNEEKAPTDVGANTATQDARKAVAKVAENGQAKVKDAGEKTATAKEGAAKPKTNIEKTESPKEGAAKPKNPDKAGTPKETVDGSNGDVEQKALAKIDAQQEKIADEQADAETAVEQASVQMDATVAGSKQTANTEVSFAPSPMKPMFATTEEGISALGPEEVLGTAGNGLVLYQTEQPEKSLSAANAGIPVQPIPEDKAAKAREQQRLQAEAALSQFMASGQERKAQIAALGTTIQPRIQTAANQSRGAVDAAISRNQSAIINGIAKARAQAQSQAQSAKSQITGRHSTAVGAIRASTTAARQRLQAEYQNSLAKLAQIERTMAARIAAPFNTAAQDFRAAGVKVGQEAVQIGAEFQGQYAKQSPPEPSNFITEFLESFDRETYVTNWRKAKVDAARDLAASYDQGLRKDADEKANQLAQNQPPVVQGMQELVATTRSSLQVKYTAALEQLNQSEQQALQTASTALNGQLQGIDRTLNGTLASLQQMQATQLSQLKKVGQQQKLGIDRTSKQATAALQGGVNQASDNLQGAFQQFSEQARTNKAPSLQVIQAVIAEAQGQLNSLIADARTEVETGITNAAQGIVQQSQQTVGSLNTLGQQAASSGAAVVQELSTSIAQAVQSASQTFSQLQSGHTNATKASADKATGEFKQMTGDVEQKLDGVIQNLTQKLGESAGQLENGLRGSLGNLRSEIPKKAQEAADQVQPAWKSVVKVLIDIAITVAVTVAIAALAASGVGLVAAIGLAALIGAAGALVKQGANDLIDGKMSSWKTYATQAGFGAVGGVLQLVGLRGAEKAAGWLTNTAGKTGAKFGIEALGETGADISQRLAAGDKFSLAMLGVSFGTSLLGGAGGEALNGAFGKLGTKLGVNKIDNAALKTGGEFVTDTISETATDVTSQVVFEGKDLSWQTVGESAGTSAFGNLVGRGANRAYGDRLRNLGRSDRATSDSPPQLIDPNTNQPIGQSPTPPQLIDPNTNQPVGQTATPPQLIDPNTNQPIGQTATPPQLIDPNTNQPIGQTATPPQLIDPNTNQPIGQTATPPQLIDPNTNQPIADTSTPTKSKDEGLTPIPSDQSKAPSKTPKDSNSETETSPEKSPLLQTEQTNNVPSARTKIEEIKDFKKLREMVEKGELGNPETAKQTLQEARNQIIDSVLDGEGGVRAILKQRYPDIEIEFKDLGSKGFGSDRDITVKVTGGKDANENARASVEGVREAYNQLRQLGFEPDKALDSNFYTELHEGNITPTSKAEAAQILQDQSMTSLAEMRMNMSPEQWQAYKQQQLESLGLGKDATGVQDSSQAEARDRLQQQLQDAENLAARLQDKSKPKEQLLEERQAALLKALEQNASPREIRQLMAEVKLLEPDAYGTRAAVEGVVDYQQAMKGDETGDKYWDIYTGRADKLPDDTSERFAVLSQEASASLAKMYSHSHGETGNSVSDVLAMAKYLGRIDHAHYEAGLSTSNNPVIDTMRQLMATKAKGGSQADTVDVLRKWAQANNLSHLTDQQKQDAWVAQAQALGQDLVVQLRSSEQMAHVFAPKDVNDSNGSGSDSSTPLQSGDSLADATATSDKTNLAETKNQTDLETLPNTPEKPKDVDESSSSLESTEVQDTSKVQSLNPDLEQILATALPLDLQGKVPINVDPDLPGNTVRVHYEVDGNGLVTNVHMRTGPDASAVDIQLHAQTVRLMERYSGFSGRIRILKERIQNWISKNGEPSVGSRAWEAKLEVEKLPRIIDERLERLSKGGLDADAQANLRADIENLQQQLATHQRSLDEMDTNPGVGFVAAEGTSRQRKFEVEVQRRLAAGEIDQDMANNLLEYNQRNPYGERSVDDARQLFEDGKVLTERGDFIEPDKRPDVKPVVNDEPSVPHGDYSPEKQQQLEEAEVERNQAREDKETAENTHGEKSDEAKEANQRIVEASEKLGEIAADAVVDKRYPGAQRLESETPGGKQGEFDRVYEHNGTIIVIVEAKGGGARRGSRKTQQGRGLRAEQGTPQYRDDIVDHMRLSAKKMADQAAETGDNALLKKAQALRETADKIAAARDSGNLVYLQVSQRLDAKGNLLPEASVESFSNIDFIRNTPEE